MKNWIRAVSLMSLFAFAGCESFQRQNDDGPRKTVTERNQLSAKRTDSGPRKRLLVLPFLDSDPNRAPAFREKARQAFLADLNRTGEVLAVDSDELKTDPMKALENGEFRLKDVAAQAKDLGVSAILEGKIIDLRVKRSADAVGIVRHMTTAFEAVVRVRMASSRGGAEIFNTVKTVTVEQGDVRVAERVESDKFIRDNPQILQVIVKDAFLDFTPQILQTLGKVSWEGRIAAFTGDRIYLNVGKISGLQIGDLLKVTEAGDDVFDPESGSHIGRVPGRMKGTLEVISFFGTDGSIAVIHSGSGFKENDKVELYQ